MTSQLDADRASNSDPIVGCVARTSDPSALAVNAPMIRIEMTLKTTGEGFLCPSSVPLSSVPAVACFGVGSAFR